MQLLSWQQARVRVPLFSPLIPKNPESIGVLSDALPINLWSMYAVRHALIFDFDGVVADTERLYWRAWSLLFASHGISFSWDDYCRFCRGMSELQMLETLPQLASEPALRSILRERMDERRQLVRSWCAERSPVSPATVNMLKELRGYRLGLVTSSDRDDVEPLLRAAGIHDCFTALVYSEDTHRHKPDPEPYLLVRKRMGFETGLAFEDSDAGLASARSAGLTAIRVDHPENLPALVSSSLSVG